MPSFIPGPIAFPALVFSFVAMMGMINFLAVRKIIHPEVSRKALHITMGLVALSFPWLFPEPLWFFISFSSIIGIIALVKFQPVARNLLGRAFYDVERRSGGEIYFALAIVALYIVARDNLALYVIPILVMTVADAFAALVGTFYGKATYLTRGGHKSWEGSAMFFVVAFMVIHIAVHLLTSFAPLDAITITFCLAFVATAIEGGSWEGLDNLFLPLVIYFLLEGFLRLNGMDAPFGIGTGSNVVILSFALIGVFVNRIYRIRSDAIMAMVAFGYFLWATQGFYLFVPGIMTGLAFLAVISGSKRRGIRKLVDGQMVTAVCLPAAIPLMLYMQNVDVLLFRTVFITFAASSSLMVAGVLAIYHQGAVKDHLYTALSAVVIGSVFGITWIVIVGMGEVSAMMNVSPFVVIALACALVATLVKSAGRRAQMSVLFLVPTAIVGLSVYFGG